MKHFKILLILLSILVPLTLNATLIKNETTSQPLLKGALVYFDDEQLTLEAVQKKRFLQYEQMHINRAFDANTVVWVHLTLENPSDKAFKKVLEVDNPLLETIRLYHQGHTTTRGMLHVQEDEHFIKPSFILTWKPHEIKELWLSLENANTALQFSVTLKNVDTFYHDDHLNQYTITVFLGIILAFFTYAIFLFGYTRDRSYLFYSFYLATLIFQQMTYVGFLPLHAPTWFTAIDSRIVVPKVGMMIIAGIWFAQAFLKTRDFPKLHKIYNALTLIVFLQMPLVGTSWFYLPEITVLTGLFFIIFNTYSGIYVYLNGNKQARFFIAGWLILIVAYLLMIFDALGVISVMHHVPSLLLWATAFEALFLLLAFVDKLSLLQQEKNSLDAKLVSELNSRNKLIYEEVEERTHDLNVAVEEKKALLKELHHRVNNNLQLILSLIRIQSQSLPCEEKEHYFTELENRIKAIAKTHETLYLNDNVDAIDMREYIESLVGEIHRGYAFHDIDIKIVVNATMPIREAVYIGLIINELVTNSMKYAFNSGKGIIDISLLQKANDFEFIYQDNGAGYSLDSVRDTSIGLDLVASLAQMQLDGSYEVMHEGALKYTIGFTL